MESGATADLEPLGLAEPMTRERVLAACLAYPAGYHLNKRHWNTVELDGSIDDDALREMISHSYDLVAAKVKRPRGA